MIKRGGVRFALLVVFLAAPSGTWGHSPQRGWGLGDRWTLTACGIQPVRRVSSALELVTLLGTPFTGRIVIPRDVEWEMKYPCGGYDEFGQCVGTPIAYIHVNSCVEIVGERGELGSRPVLYTDDKGGGNYRDATGQPQSYEGYRVFVITGNDVRIMGVHFRGPNAGLRRPEDLPHGVTAITVHENPAFRRSDSSPPEYVGRNVEIVDNEFNEWSAAVEVTGPVVDGELGKCKGYGTDYYGPRLTLLDAGNVRVLRNFFHHNARDGLGYGVVVGAGAYVTVEGNVFDFNRHAVTADCRRFTGYIARFNYLLQGGYTYGKEGYYAPHFDAHGSGVNDAVAESYVGGHAGEFYWIDSNTMRGEQEYDGTTRAGFVLRGRPEIAALFERNVLVHEGDEAFRLKNGSDSTLKPLYPATFNFLSSGNQFNTDYSAEIATGDFDGDRRADVFVANGTAWFYSRGGVSEWTFLGPSRKRVGQLGFADIDNDGVTDVLWQESNGDVYYAKRGGNTATPLTNILVPITDVRFGDFDGDKMTDMFYTRQQQWQIWYGATKQWMAAATSVKPIDELLFGDFDHDDKTDVVGITSQGWVLSKSGTVVWTPINKALISSFKNAVVGDFDADGRLDIGASDGTRWRYSMDGRSTLQPMRQGTESIKRVLVGRFDGGGKDFAVTFTGGKHFLSAWQLGAGDAFTQRSIRNMR